MYEPLFELGSYDEIPPAYRKNLLGALSRVNQKFDSLDTPNRCLLILGLVQQLVSIDKLYLLRHPEAPSLYDSGIRYRYQQSAGGQFQGVDLWWDIPTMLEMGEGSCEDLASWRVAELQLFGETARERKARPFIHSKMENGTNVYHVVVKFPDGTEEDPSVQLGMWPPWGE